MTTKTATKIKRYQAWFEESNVSLVIYAHNEYMAYKKAYEGFSNMFGYEWKGIVKLSETE